jgi:hypothetical protein
LRLSPELAWKPGVLPSHTATQQWQSFEIRMRRRRVDRCVLRAAVAIDAGQLDDARAALEEVERLDPHEPAIQPLRSRLSDAELKPAEPLIEPAPVSPAVVEAALSIPAVPDTPVPETGVVDTPAVAGLLEIPETSRRVLPASAAAGFIAISGMAGWFLFAQYTPGDPASARTDSAVVSDAKGVAQAAPAAQPTVDPTVKIAETAVTAPATSEPAIAEDPAVTAAAVADTAGNTPLAETPRPAAAPVEASSNTRPSESAATLPPTSPVERRAIQASLEPTPSLPEPEPAPPVVPTSGAVPPLAGTDRVALSGTSVTLTPPAILPAPPAVSTPAPTSTTSPAASPSTSPQADESQVRATLRRYEAAYSALDAAAASAVWPGVDRRALASAFGALSSQNVSLGRCDVRVTGGTAQAECKGTARWEPKIGAGQSASRYWRFDLKNTGTDWIITRATVR